MRFLIEADIFPEEQKALVDALTELRVDHSIWNPEGCPIYLAADNHVFFYGSIQSALRLKEVGARFQIWLGNEFDYHYFGAHLSNLLNEDYCLFTYAQLLSFKDEENYSNDVRYFRSDSGYKKFQGGLYTAKEFYSEGERVNLFKEDLLVFADKKKIDREYRLVIRSQYDEMSDMWNNAVISQTSYLKEEEPLTRLEIAKIESDLNCDTYRPYPLWVLDVAVSEGEIFQLEANSINTSGLYNSDYKAIVGAILDIEKKEIV